MKKDVKPQDLKNIKEKNITDEKINAGKKIHKTYESYAKRSRLAGTDDFRSLLAYNGEVIKSLDDLKPGDFFVVANSGFNGESWNKHSYIAQLGEKYSSNYGGNLHTLKNLYELGGFTLSNYAEDTKDIGLVFEQKLFINNKGEEYDEGEKSALAVNKRFDDLYKKIEDNPQLSYRLSKRTNVLVIETEATKIKHLISKGVVYKLNEKFTEEIIDRAIEKATDIHKSPMDPTKSSKYCQFYANQNYNCNHFIRNTILNAAKEINKDRSFAEKYEIEKNTIAKQNTR